jgi:hypothetical protein
MFISQIIVEPKVYALIFNTNLLLLTNVGQLSFFPVKIGQFQFLHHVMKIKSIF